MPVLTFHHPVNVNGDAFSKMHHNLHSTALHGNGDNLVWTVDRDKHTNW